MHTSVRPPTTFGVVRMVKSSRPGSTRSGEKASEKSLPAARPDSSSMGSSRSRVVPGYDVDSSTTSCPARSTRVRAWVASTNGPRSGSRLTVSGVGTHSSTASACASGPTRVVGSSRSRISCSSALGMSSM